MEFSKIIFFAIFSAIIAIVLRRMKEEYALFVSCFAGIIIITISLSILVPIVDYIRLLSSRTNVGNFSVIMLKCTGIALLCNFAGELCSDCGEKSLGAKIELFGKCTMLSYALPLIKSVFDYALQFIS